MSNDPTEQRPSPSYLHLLWFLIAVLGVLLVQSLYGYAVLYRLGPSTEIPGQFGDLFGGINAFFTGLAFAGVIYTILLQRHDLALQREELRLTRNELHASAEAQQDQVAQLRDTARLTALTALLDVYSADLQTLRDIEVGPRRDIAAKRAELISSGRTWDHITREVYEEDIAELWQGIRENRNAWSSEIEKHEHALEQLELLYRQLSNDESSDSD